MGLCVHTACAGCLLLYVIVFTVQVRYKTDQKMVSCCMLFFHVLRLLWLSLHLRNHILTQDLCIFIDQYQTFPSSLKSCKKLCPSNFNATYLIIIFWNIFNQFESLKMPLLKWKNYIVLTLDSNSISLLLSLDLSSAFDSIDHVMIYGILVIDHGIVLYSMTYD